MAPHGKDLDVVVLLVLLPLLTMELVLITRVSDAGRIKLAFVVRLAAARPIPAGPVEGSLVNFEVVMVAVVVARLVTRLEELLVVPHVMMVLDGRDQFPVANCMPLFGKEALL